MHPPVCLFDITFFDFGITPVIKSRFVPKDAWKISKCPKFTTLVLWNNSFYGRCNLLLRNGNIFEIYENLLIPINPLFWDKLLFDPYDPWSWPFVKRPVNQTPSYAIFHVFFMKSNKSTPYHVLVPKSNHPTPPLQNPSFVNDVSLNFLCLFKFYSSVK
jgi:hypothetical protein